MQGMRTASVGGGWKLWRRHVVGYGGGVGKQAGIGYLLRAVRNNVNECGRRDVQFALVGGGTSLDEMREYAKELEVTEYVTFTGRVSDDVLLDVLNTADVRVNPDVANEMNDKSTMNKIMEYMALGKPIVQFDLTEGRVSAQDASLYANRNDEIDLARKLIRLLDDPALRNEMGRRGQRRVETELAWKYEAPKLLAAYDSVFGVKGGEKAAVDIG